MSRGSRAELVKACRRANRELRQHRLYLDQLLAIVIERQPEILSMVAEAQKMRLERTVLSVMDGHCTLVS